MRHVLTAAFIASFAAGVAAQQPATPGQQPAAPGQPPATRAEQPPTTQAAKVMIAGCIQATPPAAAGGAAASTPAASKFDLANAKVVSSGPVGTTGGAATATRYRLDGDEKTISPHLNHQVEITGTVSPAAGAGGAATPMLKVESVKMLAATCPTAAPGTTP